MVAFLHLVSFALTPSDWFIMKLYLCQALLTSTACLQVTVWLRGCKKQQQKTQQTHTHTHTTTTKKKREKKRKESHHQRTSAASTVGKSRVQEVVSPTSFFHTKDGSDKIWAERKGFGLNWLQSAVQLKLKKGDFSTLLYNAAVISLIKVIPMTLLETTWLKSNDMHGFAWSDIVHGCMVYTECAKTAAVSCGTSKRTIKS